MTETEEVLTDEVARLRRLLTYILDCANPKCGSLCAECVFALQSRNPIVERPVPVVGPDDPIRIIPKSRAVGRITKARAVA